MARTKKVETTIDVIVVGPAAKTIVKSLNTGDQLVIRLNTYPQDPTAIKLETVDGVDAGYVAARTATANGYPLAKDVFDMVSEGDLVKVSSLDPFLISIPKKDVKESNGIIKKTMYLMVTGNKFTYPARLDLAREVRNKQSVEIDYKIENNNIVFSLNGVPCGMASANYNSTAKATLSSKGIELSPIDDIIAAITEADKVVANAKLLDGINIPVEFVITSKNTITTTPKNKSLKYETLIKEFKEHDQIEIQKRISWLKANNVAEYAINLFLKRMEGKENIQEFNPGYIPNGREVEKAIAFTASGGNLLLKGPAGSGKNQFLATFRNLLDLELIDKSCSSGTDEDSIFGILNVKPTEDAPNPDAINEAIRKFIELISKNNFDKGEFVNNNTEEKINMIENLDTNTDLSVLITAMRSNSVSIQFEPSVITKALERPSIINFDEVNSLRPQVSIGLNSMLDTRRNVLISGYRQVNIHKDVIFTATMNEGNDYSGTNILNKAFEDRWHVIEFKAPNDIIKIINQEVPELTDTKAIKLLNEIYKRMSAVKGVEIQERSFSQRAFIRAAKNIAQGQIVKFAILDCIAEPISDPEDKEWVISLVDLLIK